MRENLRSLQVSRKDVGSLRVLLYGPVGAGKSSFTNSIDSIFQERMTSGAAVDTATSLSFTKAFQTLKIKDRKYEAYLPFVVCDAMGLEAHPSKGVHPEDLISILQGHIEDGYTFNPARPCSRRETGYNSSPKLCDRIHCLVSVIPAYAISMMDDAVFSRMKQVRTKAAEMRIPEVTILTKVDQVCPKVAKDIKRIYKSTKVRDKMQECSNRLGVQMKNIFPVKNYDREINLDDHMDVVLLSALTHILNFANDHVAALADKRSSMARGTNFNNDDMEEKTYPGFQPALPWK